MPRGQPLERVKKIFNALTKKPLSLSALAKQAGIHYYTAEEYVDMIIEIQNSPRLEKIESTRTVLVRLQEN
jgi:lambda repressor-like predicted transcriptional regulator